MHSLEVHYGAVYRWRRTCDMRSFPPAVRVLNTLSTTDVTDIFLNPNIYYSLFGLFKFVAPGDRLLFVNLFGGW